METKKFNCKMEEVPVLAGFAVESLQGDLTDFQANFSDYTVEKVNALVAKRNFCLELERSNSVIQQLKNATAKLVEKELALRPALNKLEGYVKRTSEGLDIAADGFGFKAIRDNISRGNDEGIIGGMKTLLSNVNRNKSALEANGLKPEFVTELSVATSEIDALNNEQNRLENLRNATTSANIKDYNELWDLTTAVCQDARAIYKGVDEVKLKKYSISALLKRVNAEGDRTPKTDAKA